MYKIIITVSQDNFGQRSVIVETSPEGMPARDVIEVIRSLCSGSEDSCAGPTREV